MNKDLFYIYSQDNLLRIILKRIFIHALKEFNRKPQINTTFLYHKIYYYLNRMNVYLFWILFLALWAIVPLMIIKGKTDENPNLKTSPEIKSKKKGWFK